MSGLAQLTRKPTLLLSMLVGGVIFTSCASAPQSASQAIPEVQGNKQVADTAARTEVGGSGSRQAEVPRSRPQLVKTAAMTLIVDSLNKSIDAVSQIINKQQGDLIRLEEQQPKDEYAVHTASIELRVPQNLLSPTLDELAKLGTVESRNITAEDVGDHLVDLQARLNNLRKTESNLQKIMDRAGSIKDVLSVAKELSDVRQSIEQIDAQLKNLQNQVAYSTITLNLEAAVSSSNQHRALGSQIQETWNNSTHSLGELTVTLLKLGIWLIVYSPCFLILAAAYGLRPRRRTRPVGSASESVNSD